MPIASDQPISNFLSEVLKRPGLSDLIFKRAKEGGRLHLVCKANRQITEVNVPAHLHDGWSALIDLLLPGRTNAANIGEFEDFSAFDDKDGGLRRFRASLSTNLDGDELVLRVLPERILTPAELLLPDPLVRNFCAADHGLFLFVGGTGHGKTTTMTGLVKERCSRRAQKVVTIEDPVEYLYGKVGASDISQRQVGLHTASFASGLKAAMRMSPDLIVVGEIRDTASAAIAISASLSGHVVAGTMHGDVASLAPQRLFSFINNAHSGMEGAVGLDMIASGMRGIVAQQLVRRDGRNEVIPIYECLFATTGVGNKIRNGDFKKLHQDIETGRTRGMQSFAESIALRITQRRLPHGFRNGSSD